MNASVPNPPLIGDWSWVNLFNFLILVLFSIERILKYVRKSECCGSRLVCGGTPATPPASPKTSSDFIVPPAPDS